LRTNEGFVIEDGSYDEQNRHVESRNGTFVNDEKMSGARLLADSDVVRVGKFFLTFNLASDAQTLEPTRQEMI
jgi:pSer/pThr/pTyr-binding forkhead associated (FHA) protein